MEQQGENVGVRSFAVDVPQARLEALERLIAAAPIGYAPSDDADWRYGTDAAALTRLRDHWLTSYDWREHERALNSHPQFVARVGGIDVHFYHVRAEGGSGLPLILTHGWPGSVVEFLEVIPLLVARGHDVVVPSLPGYGFSGRPPRPIGPRRVAGMWRELMTEVLGYERFGAQGGDWGAMVTRALAHDHADVVAAAHVNILFGASCDDGSEEYRTWKRDHARIMARESAYMREQSTEPQTIGLALASSPVAFACWVMEKLHRWSGGRGELEQKFGLDAVITNVMTYVATDSVQSAIWMYRGVVEEEQFDERSPVPLGFANYPDELFRPPPRSAVERGLGVVRWTDMPSGGHFAAWEEPADFAEEVGTFFARWR
ncbi:epoxide hydrolase family protein [Nocardia flavorosea]|uniref:Epoxide hydrolase n=1 Tax=Nocardia flavorosea TaxID=53429 RepID=A0A846YCQ1_9NOCA|nr:epoxide hydrolase family protein [Nocardia flavorosea]NKY54589.1 epoxide hydrolase [Nocardia flavorosea]